MDMRAGAGQSARVQRLHVPSTRALAWFLSVLVVGCSNDASDGSSATTSFPATSATLTAIDGLCASAVPVQYEFFQSLPTTVGEIRNVTGGPAPGSRLWPNALAGHADDDTAAWCQGKDAGTGYVFFVVTADGTTDVLGYQRGLDVPPPAGPPLVE